MSGRFGDMLLSLLLIAVGMVMVVGLTFQGMAILLGIVAIVAGVLRFAGK